MQIHTALFLCLCCGFAVQQGDMKDSQTSSITPVTNSKKTINYTESSDPMTGSTEHSTAVRTTAQSTHWTSSTLTLKTTAPALNSTDNSSVTPKPDHMTSITTLTAVSVFNTTSRNVTVNTGDMEDSQTSSITPVTNSKKTINYAESSDPMTGSTEPSTAVRTTAQSTHWTSSTLTLKTTALALNSTDNSSVTPKPDHMTSITTLTAVSVFNTTSRNVTVNTGSADVVAANPGLVAVLCIFFITLALVVTIGIAKAVTSRKPKFETLDDLLMDKMNEKSPFAQYPPK